MWQKKDERVGGQQWERHSPEYTDALARRGLNESFAAGIRRRAQGRRIMPDHLAILIRLHRVDLMTLAVVRADALLRRHRQESAAARDEGHSPCEWASKHPITLSEAAQRVARERRVDR